MSLTRCRALAFSGLLLALPVLAGCSSADAGEPLVIQPSDGRRDAYVAEIFAAALREAGYKVRVAEGLGDLGRVMPADNGVIYLVNDLDLLEQRKRSDGLVFSAEGRAEVDRALIEGMPGYSMIARTRVVGRDVLVYGAGTPEAKTIRELAGQFPQRPQGQGGQGPEQLSVTVRDTFGEPLKRRLSEVFPNIRLVLTPPPIDLVKSLSGPATAAIVPDTDEMAQDKNKYHVLRDETGLLPSRTLVALAKKSVGDPARKVLTEVGDALDTPTVDQVALKGRPDTFAAKAQAWVRDAALPLPKIGDNSRQTGVPLPLLIPLVAIAGGLATLALVWKLGWRPRRRRDPTGPLPPASPDLGRPVLREAVTTAYPAPVHAQRPAESGPHEPLVLGRAPKPIPMHLPYVSTSAQSGVALDGGLLKGVTVRAASVRGRSHSYRGETRQDAFGIRLSSDERWVIIAVADGLGSARHAELASAAAVHAVLERVNEDLARDPRPEQWEWKAVTSHVAKAIEMVTDNLGSVVPGTNAGGRTPGAKPGTTLTVGVVPATGEGQGICAAVGDSPALLLSGGKWYEVVGAGVKDSHNANLTSALPGDFGDVEVRAFAWHAGDLLIITSDGFAASVAGGQTDFARRLTTLWRSPPGLPEFHRQVDFRASTFDDDRTVVALWAGAYDTAVR